MDGMTITAANSIYMMAFIGIFDTPVRLQGFAVDAAFDTESAEAAEVVKGVDGFMSAGFVPFLTMQNINVMPDNNTSIMFETVWEAQKRRREVFYAQATIAIPSIGRKYTMTRGILRNGASIPGVHKTLQARVWGLVWDEVDPVPFIP